MFTSEQILDGMIIRR